MKSLPQTGSTRGTAADGRHETLRRAGALAGSAALLGLAARRGTAGAMTGAAALALPLAVRGIAGRWPLEHALHGPDPVDVAVSLTIARPAQEIYDAWRDLERLPETLRHVEEVEELGGGRSRWVARTAVGGRFEWRAEIVEERPGELLRWRSLPGSDLSQEGSLELTPWRDGEGTLLRVRLRLGPPQDGRGPAALGHLVCPALAVQLREDLRRFKNRLEAGEVPVNRPQPAGERAAFTATNPF